ncbi:MAG: DUF5683 domain-containing protein [Porphyromonas sp.]|nr:DUF5683 domain-containing protein [Porphyromonas sp.]
MTSRHYGYLLVLLLMLFSASPLVAQETTEPTTDAPYAEAPPALGHSLSLADSMQIEASKRLANKTVESWRPRGGKALLWAILPGGGQIYNRKYWKLPIVWGSLATCGYFIAFNGRMYSEYHAAYRDLMSADPATNTAWLAFAPQGTKAEDYGQFESLKSTLKRGNDYYRRYRDLSIVLAIGIYGLSMLDAYVDAELFTFDISPDLSMRVAPTMLPSAPGQGGGRYQFGMGCQLTF